VTTKYKVALHIMMKQMPVAAENCLTARDQGNTALEIPGV